MAVRLQVHSLADNFGQERHIHLGQSCHLATNELQHFLPAIVFAKTLPHGGNDTACSSPSRSFEIVLLAKTSKSEKIVAEIGREVADVGRPTNHGVASSGSHRQG